MPGTVHRPCKRVGLSHSDFPNSSSGSLQTPLLREYQTPLGTWTSMGWLNSVDSFSCCWTRGYCGGANFPLHWVNTGSVTRDCCSGRAENRDEWKVLVAFPFRMLVSSCGFLCLYYNYSIEYLLSLHLNWDAYHVLSNTWKTGSFIEEEIGGGEVKGSCCWLYGADLKSPPPVSHDLSSSWWGLHSTAPVFWGRRLGNSGKVHSCWGMSS